MGCIVKWNQKLQSNFGILEMKLFKTIYTSLKLGNFKFYFCQKGIKLNFLCNYFLICINIFICVDICFLFLFLLDWVATSPFGWGVILWSLFQGSSPILRLVPGIWLESAFYYGSIYCFSTCVSLSVYFSFLPLAYLATTIIRVENEIRSIE